MKVSQSQSLQINYLKYGKMLAACLTKYSKLEIESEKDSQGELVSIPIVSVKDLEEPIKCVATALYLRENLIDLYKVENKVHGNQTLVFATPFKEFEALYNDKTVSPITPILKNFLYNKTEATVTVGGIDIGFFVETDENGAELVVMQFSNVKMFKIFNNIVTLCDY